MKKTIVFICVVTLAITINSCQPSKYFACCDTGHTHWEGDHTDSSTQAQSQASDHDKSLHGGVKTAGICNK